MSCVNTTCKSINVSSSYCRLCIVVVFCDTDVVVGVGGVYWSLIVVIVLVLVLVLEATVLETSLVGYSLC